MFSSGRLPLRAAGRDPGLPTVGTGDFEWRGLRSVRTAMRRRSTRQVGGDPQLEQQAGAGRRRGRRRTSRTARCTASISCAHAVAAHKQHTLATLTGAMNKAATQDLRVVRVWPIVKAVLQTGTAPSARAEAAASLLDNWRLSGSSRLDRDLDGNVDDPGAAVMDAAWPRIADAVMTPGARAARRPARPGHGRSDDAGPGGSSYNRAGTATSTRICERCSAARCAGRIRAATAARACSRPAARRCGTRSTPRPPSSRRRRALRRPRGEPMRRRSGSSSRRAFLPDTMRWSNRPTFQQLMSFSSHRPR